MVSRDMFGTRKMRLVLALLEACEPSAVSHHNRVSVRALSGIAKFLADELITAAKGSSSNRNFRMIKYINMKQERITMLVMPIVPTPFLLKPHLVSTTSVRTFDRESNYGGCITSSHRHLTRRWVPLRLSCSSKEGVEVGEDADRLLDSGSTVVRKFYEGINGRDLRSVENLIPQNCVYEDLIFPKPFVGRKAILDFFNKFIDSFSADLQFVVDDITEDDDSAVGVTLHLEWRRKAFPFSRGCSFFRLEVFDGQRQILYGRDSVEPAIKPGESALVIIRGVIWLLQQFPQLAKFL